MSDPVSRVVHSDPSILGGTPVFVGTRVPMETLLDYLEAGDALGEFSDHFPSVSRKQAIFLKKGFAIAAPELAKEMLKVEAVGTLATSAQRSHSPEAGSQAL